MITKQAKVTIKGNDVLQIQRIANLVQNIINTVPFDTQLKLAAMAEKNPKGISKLLSNPMVKAALK